MSKNLKKSQKMFKVFKKGITKNPIIILKKDRPFDDEKKREFYKNLGYTITEIELDLHQQAIDLMDELDQKYNRVTQESLDEYLASRIMTKEEAKRCENIIFAIEEGIVLECSK